ncbi:MAG: hypothetical protein ACI8Q1_000115 [Parvicella sp.]|jgi:hypothetical protein
MNILYLAELDPIYEKGVYYKIIGQCNAWISKGHSVKLALITPDFPQLELPSYVEVFKSSFSIGLPHNFVFNYFRKTLMAGRIKRRISHENIDILYFRQSIWFPGLGTILSACISIMEINTDDTSEMKYSSRFKRWVYFLFKNRTISYLDGLVAVTEELAKKYRAYDKPVVVVSNGYDYSLLESKDNSKISLGKNIIFVCSNLPWHGLDKVLMLARHFTKYDFHLVGPNLQLAESNFKHGNLIYHGFLSKTELNDIYERMDIGIGSLSLYLYELTEACPLKTREYLAHGLPVVLGYKDSDISDSDEFALNLGSFPNNVLDNLDRIEEFIDSWKGRSIPTVEVKERIDYQMKEDQRLLFFTSLL